MRRLTDDQKLQADVEYELANDFLIDESLIEVEVVDHVVTLMGTVGSYAEKVVAQNTARAVEGVHDLVNAVTVKPSEAMHPSDEELQRIVEQVLSWDALVPEQDLTVTVSDGLVALTGTVVAAPQAREAERAVSHIGGVRGVLNRIEIVEPDVSTGDVRRAIAEALGRRAAHQATHIDVVVDGDSVTLAGTTQSAQEKRAILGAVSHAPGISRVHDEMEVVGQPPAVAG